MTKGPTPTSPDQLDTLTDIDRLLRQRRWRMSVKGPDDDGEYRVKIYTPIPRVKQVDMFEVTKQTNRETDVKGYGVDSSLRLAVLEAWDEASGEKKGAAE